MSTVHEHGTATGEAAHRVRRTKASRHPASVAVVSTRDVVRAGLVAWIGRYPDRLLLQGSQDARFADVLLIDAHGGPERAHSIAPAPHDRQRTVVVVDRSDELASAKQWWPDARLLTLDVGATELIDALSEGDAVEDAVQARWPGDDVGLSRRESQVLSQLSLGRTNAEIAAALFINVETVKTHLKQAYRRIGARNRVEAAAWAVDRDLALAPAGRSARHPQSRSR